MNASADLPLIRSLLIAPVLILLSFSVAMAADGFAPAVASPDQTQCKLLGDGFYAVKGSTACVRISGYIAAGVTFAAPPRLGAPAGGAFAPRPGAGADTHAGASVDARFDTEFGPSRLYIQVGKDHVQP
jgi:hypothetical protein